jgi:hypothetical protein
MRPLLLTVVLLPCLAALAAEGPAHPAPAEPAAGEGLHEVPAERQEALRDRRMQVKFTLKDGSDIQGVLEGYEPGKEGLPGTFVVGIEGDKTKVIYEVDVARVAVGEAVKEARPARRELSPEVLEAIRAGTVEQLMARTQTALKKATSVKQAHDELWRLRYICIHRRHLGLEKMPLWERLQTEVNTIENEQVRDGLRKKLQEERYLWLRPGPARLLAPAREPDKN